MNTIRSLYFVVAALIGVALFGENLSMTNIGGIADAVVAVVLFTAA